MRPGIPAKTRAVVRRGSVERNDAFEVKIRQAAAIVENVRTCTMDCASQRGTSQFFGAVVSRKEIGVAAKSPVEKPLNAERAFSP